MAGGVCTLHIHVALSNASCLGCGQSAYAFSRVGLLLHTGSYLDGSAGLHVLHIHEAKAAC